MLGYFKTLINKVSGNQDDQDVDTQGATDTTAAPPTKLRELQVGDYQIKPLDAVLWCATDPNDPIAGIIKKIELHEVVPNIEKPFHELWTHAGIIVDKSVLPLDCLEDRKLYVFESVMAGQIVGIVFSTVLPVDHPTKKGGFHLGPQLRDFAAVVESGDADVGICPLSPPNRAFLEQRLKEDPNLILDIYNEHKDFGYPMINPLPIIASASQHLHQDLDYFGSIVGGWIPDTKKDNIFCSELVATIYRRVGFETFKTHGPETFTPLEIQAVPEFDGIVYYAKENKNLLLKNGGTTLGANPVVTRCQQVVHGLRLRENWVKMPPSGGVPANAHKAGIDTDGVALYIARVKIGSSYRIGKIRADQKAPWIGYCKREIPIKYGHEVMVNLEETVWEEAENGNAPPHAVEAGVEEDGTIFYVARAHVGASGGFLGFGEDDGGWSVGACAPNLKGASLPYDGEEVHVTKYQVLCHKQ